MPHTPSHVNQRQCIRHARGHTRKICTLVKLGTADTLLNARPHKRMRVLTPEDVFITDGYPEHTMVRYYAYHVVCRICSDGSDLVFAP